MVSVVLTVCWPVLFYGTLMLVGRRDALLLPLARPLEECSATNNVFGQIEK